MAKKYISPYKDPMEYPDVIDFGNAGVQWRGQDIPLPDSPYPNDYTAVFGFTCVCGGSGINQEPIAHTSRCIKPECNK